MKEASKLSIRNFIDHSFEQWELLLLDFDTTVNYTSWFLKYIEVLNAKNDIQNYSFALYLNSIPIAIVPLYVESIDNNWQISMGQEPVFGPVFNKNIEKLELSKYYDFLLSEVDKLANKFHCKLARFQFSPLLIYSSIYKNFENFGYIEEITYPDWYIFKSNFSFILNLDKNKELLFRGIRKGHKSNIKYTKKIAKLIVLDKQSFKKEFFSRYMDLYYEVKGNKRSFEAFNLDMIAIKSGLQSIMICEFNKEFIGAIAFHTYNNKARYNSSVQLYNINTKIYPTHFLLWSGIKYLKDRNFKLLEIGNQVLESEIYKVSKKEKNLSHFKAGWGCDLVSCLKIQKDFTNV